MDKEWEEWVAAERVQVVNVCQACGHREPHQQGQPCNQKKCPKCGQTMTRG